MNEDNYREMLRDLLHEMEQLQPDDPSIDAEPLVLLSVKIQKTMKLFNDFNCYKEAKVDNAIIKYEVELNAYKHSSVSSLLYNSNGNFNNPLDWQRSEGVFKFPILAILVKKFLCIPATSARSKRVWSRVSRILSIKRSALNDEVTASIMFTKENTHILKKHYKIVTGKEYILILPAIDNNVFAYEDEDNDVGQG